MGCGLAYHLALEGWRDVVLLEKAELTSGSTWHAAGQITRSTSSFGLGKCIDYNIFLYSGALEERTGRHVGWHGCGSLRLAYSDDELDWLRHTLSVGRALGFDMEIVGPQRISRLHPFYNLDGVRAALHTPDDGHVDPSGVTHAMAAGARELGVTFVQRCRATGIQPTASGSWQVRTEAGDITCDHVVNAAGTYARQIGAWCGLQVPATSMTHHYLVTETVPEFEALERELPVVRDDRMVSGYVRMEQKAGLVGIYEKTDPRSVWEDHCPWDAENELFTPEYDRIFPWLNNAMKRMPVLEGSGFRRVVHGSDQPPSGRKSPDRAGSGRHELLVLLRNPDRDWLGTRADAGAGAVDGARCRRHFHAGLRPAPFWIICGSGLAGGQGEGGLLPSPRNTVPELQQASRDVR